MSALSCYLEEEESEEKKREEITPSSPSPCSSRESGDPQHMKKVSIRSQLNGRVECIPDPDLAGLDIVCFPMVLKKTLACYRSLEFRDRSEQILSRPEQILCRF